MPTAQRDIKELVDNGILIRNEGGSKNTSYSVAGREPVFLRVPIDRVGRLDRYSPSQKFQHRLVHEIRLLLMHKMPRTLYDLLPHPFGKKFSIPSNNSAPIHLVVPPVIIIAGTLIGADIAAAILSDSTGMVERGTERRAIVAKRRPRACPWRGSCASALPYPQAPTAIRATSPPTTSRGTRSR